MKEANSRKATEQH